MNAIKILTTAILAFGAGVGFSYLFMSSDKEPVSATQDNKPLYWVAPMDPNYKRDQPGKSPMGMDLVPVYEEVDEDMAAGTVSISSAVVNNLGVKLGKAIKEDLPLQVRTVGIIGFNEEKVSHFHSRVEGWIEQLSITAVGDPVLKGQKLIELYSPELVNAQEEFLIAMSGGNQRLVSAAAQKLSALGIQNSQISELKKTRKVKQRMEFFAQQDGYVAVLNVREGSYIKPATNVISVGSLESVWVIAEIFERQAGWVEAGQRVVMTTDSYPDREWVGKVDYLYPVLNSKTRTMRARIVFANKEQLLKPNMFTRLIIDAGAHKGVVSIPREAVIRSEGYSRVVKSLGQGRFISSRIETGVESNGRVEIIEGLKANNEVVISGQFLIDSESSISAELSRIDVDETVEEEENNTVFAEGEINKVMPDMRMLEITHEPIPEWQWPKMKMMFNVSQDIELSSFEVGQKISFELTENEGGEYVVIKIY